MADAKGDIFALFDTPRADQWAAEFMAIWGDRKDEIDESLMIGWFANAIETGKRFGAAETGGSDG